MSWLADYFRRSFIRSGGTPLQDREALNFIGFTVADNPTTKAIDITAPGGSGSPPTGTGPVTVTAGVQDAAAGTTTGTGAYVRQTSSTLITPSINNPADTFRYIVGGSAIVANRSVTLPLLTVDDTFVFAAHAQTLTNKTINGASNTITNVSLTAGVTGTLPVGNGGTGITSLGAGVSTLLGAAPTGTAALVGSTSPTFRTDFRINNPANTFAYTFTPAAIAAARSITLPLLTGNDTMVTAAFPQTLTNKTLTSPIINGQVQGPVVAIAAMAIDWTLSTGFTKTLAAGANTFTWSGAASNMSIDVRVTGAASTLTWPAGIRWAGGVAPTQTPSGTDVYTFWHDGTNIYGSAIQAMA